MILQTLHSHTGEFMETADSETTQIIDLSALRDGSQRKPRKERVDLYEVSADNMAGDSIPGLIRHHNEDNFACCAKPDGHLSLAITADGIGGGEFGEIASFLCVSNMIREWRKFSAKYQDTVWETAQSFLTGSLERTNSLVYQYSCEKGVHMGTTVAAILFADRYAVIANAGDSRVYRLRNNELEMLSTDHTPVAEALSRGEISLEEARRSPFRHTITRAIGVEETLVPQIRIVDHFPGDSYLLCTDGLTIHVPDEEIRQEMEACYDPVQCVDHLLRRALRGGAHDNVTIISIFA